MADHGQVEYATATGNDLPAHEATYNNFVQLIYIGCCHAASFLIGLAIGGTTGSWWTALGIFIFATLVAMHGLATGARTPSMAMVGLSFLALALTAGS